MLQNPIHLRLERLESWQHVTFMACLCERMYPNYAMFCQQTGFGDGQIYRRILDLIWETLTVKDAKVNFDSQLEKFEEAIPSADDFDLYGVYPAIDACVALSELVHSRLSGETLEHAVEVSKTSITTVAMLEMTQAGREMSDEELKENPAVEQEWDIQWEIFRLLAECEERDIELIKGLRADLREAGESNVGIIFSNKTRKRDLTPDLSYLESSLSPPVWSTFGGRKKWLSVRVCRRVLFWHFRRTRCLASDKHIVRITYEQDSTD